MNREKKAHLPWRCTLGISFILLKKGTTHECNYLFLNIKWNVYKLKNENENLARSSTKHLLLLQIKQKQDQR